MDSPHINSRQFSQIEVAGSFEDPVVGLSPVMKRRLRHADPMVFSVHNAPQTTVKNSLANRSVSKLVGTRNVFERVRCDTPVQFALLEKGRCATIEFVWGF
eukprot:s11_g50.t1